jgi:hypothetical protein
VSQLKLASGFCGAVSPALPTDLSQYRVPLQVMESRMVVRADYQVPQVKVTWSQLPNSLATWEDLTALKQAFPDALVVKQRLNERGMLVLPGTRQKKLCCKGQGVLSPGSPTKQLPT